MLSLCGLSPVAAIRGSSLLAVHRLLPTCGAQTPPYVRCTDSSLRRLLLLWSTGSRAVGLSSSDSWFPKHKLNRCAHQFSCSVACGLLSDQSGTCVSCTGRWTLYHWTTREAPRTPWFKDPWILETLLMFQWLRLCTPKAGDLSSFPV